MGKLVPSVISQPRPGTKQCFHLAASYWPSRTGMFWWEDFRRDEVLRDFDAAAELRLNHLVISLLWNDFQPEMERVSVPAMRSLERVLDAAADREIALELVLFPVKIASLLWLPRWTLDRVGEPGPAVLAGHAFIRRPVRDLFHDERLMAAQLRLVAEIVGVFADHPAVSEWILGDRVTAACQPPSPAAFEEWLGSLAEAARAAGARQPLGHGLSAVDVIRSAEVDLSVMGRWGVKLHVADDWRALWARGASAWWPAFLAGYATRLSGAPAIVSHLRGAAGERPVEAEPAGAAPATALERAVALVREVGGGGCTAAFLLDFADELRRSSPFQEDPQSLRSGLLAVDLRPKGSATVWSELARRQDAVLPVPGTFPEPDPELRLRRPETTARECFEAFTG